MTEDASEYSTHKPMQPPLDAEEFVKSDARITDKDAVLVVKPDCQSLAVILPDDPGGSRASTIVAGLALALVRKPEKVVAMVVEALGGVDYEIEEPPLTLEGLESIGWLVKCRKCGRDGMECDADNEVLLDGRFHSVAHLLGPGRVPLDGMSGLCDRCAAAEYVSDPDEVMRLLE